MGFAFVISLGAMGHSPCTPRQLQQMGSVLGRPVSAECTVEQNDLADRCVDLAINVAAEKSWSCLESSYSYPGRCIGNGVVRLGFSCDLAGIFIV